MRGDNAKKGLTYIYAVMLAVTVFLVALGSYFSSKHSYRNGDYESFSGGWISDMGEEADLNNIEAYSYIYKTVPYIEDELSLLLHVKSVNVSIYVGAEKLYETGNYNERIFGHTPGSYFVRITLKENYTGQEIIIVPSSPYNDGSGRIKEVYLGDGVDILRNMVCNKLAGFLLSVIVVLIGLILILLYIVTHKLEIVSVNMLYLGLFALSVGSYLVCDNWVFGLLIGHESLFHTMAELWMKLIPIPFVLYFSNQYQFGGKLPVVILCVMSIVDFTLSVLANSLNILDYHEIITFTHLCFVVIIIYFIYLSVRAGVSKMSIQRHRIFGMLSIFGGAVIDIVLWRIGLSGESSMFTRLGMLLFLILEGGQLITDMMSKYKNTYKNELLRRLAYRDGLTDLLNRTSYKEALELLEGTGNCSFVAVFDVNNLKLINDTFGHVKGDELIVTVATALKNVFSDFGSCYRIGGDEFVFLSDERLNTETLQGLLSDFDGILAESSAEREYEVSVAYGYMPWDKSMSIKDAIKEADSRMYDRKKEMKQMKKGD